MPDSDDQPAFATLIARLTDTVAQLHQVYKGDLEAARLEIAQLQGVNAPKHGNAKSNGESLYLDPSSVDLSWSQALAEEANGVVAQEATSDDDIETAYEQGNLAEKPLVNEEGVARPERRTPTNNSLRDRRFAMRTPWVEHQWSEEVMRFYESLSSETERHEMTAAAYIEQLQRYETRGIVNLPWYILHPESRIRGYWVIACMLFLLYDTVMVPVEVCFDLEDTDASKALTVFFSCFWTMDIFLNFITGIPRTRRSDFVDTVESNPYQIARKYIKSWFIFDVCLVVPEWMTMLIETEDVQGTNNVSAFRVIRYARFVRLLRMARIVKVSRFQRLIRPLIYMFNLSKIYIQLTQTLIYVTIFLLLAIHVLSCFWYAIGDWLENGWVETNGFKSATVGSSYAASMHWSFSRVHGMKSQFDMEASSEMLLDGFLIYICLGVAAYYFGRVGAIAVISANGQQNNLWKQSLIFEQRHHISSHLGLKVAKFLECASSYGAGEAAAEEEAFLAKLPDTLSNDLIFEARLPYVVVVQLFKDMLSYSPRSVRQLCTVAIQSHVITDGEVVFVYSDACHGMLLLTSGEATYTSGPSQGTNELLGQSNEPVQVGTNRSVSEPTLWTKWNHAGTLVASEESIALFLDPKLMGTVIEEHPIALGHAVKYAKHFLRHMNNAECNDDLTCFPDLTIKEVSVELFDGDINDHFVFISHYKVEAGTEASLMRDLMIDMLRQDPNHPANELRSPIFIDSEDLTDLAGLKTHVEQTNTLVVLLTPGVLTRPWCLVEIVTAQRNGLNFVPVEVQRPGSRYTYPDDKFYADILDGKFLPPDAMDILTSEGMGLEDVEKAIRQLFLKIALPFSPHKTKEVRKAELTDILKRCDKDSRSSHQSHPRPVP